MTRLKIPSPQQIVLTNKFLCQEGGNPHHCSDIGKIESAIHTAFYPGSYPFAAGGIAQVAGALCFYLVQAHAFVDGNKRTGALASIQFLNLNGWDLQYPLDPTQEINALAEIILKCASSQLSKEELMNWFDIHKVQQTD